MFSKLLTVGETNTKMIHLTNYLFFNLFVFLQYKMTYFYVDIYFVSLQVSGVMSFIITSSVQCHFICAKPPNQISSEQMPQRNTSWAPLHGCLHLFRIMLAINILYRLTLWMKKTDSAKLTAKSTILKSLPPADEVLDLNTCMEIFKEHTGLCCNWRAT